MTTLLPLGCTSQFAKEIIKNLFCNRDKGLVVLKENTVAAGAILSMSAAFSSFSMLLTF
jgi:hypothetical protein